MKIINLMMAISMLSILTACSGKADECEVARSVAKGYAAKMFDIALAGSKGASAYNSVLGFPEALEDAKKKCNDPTLTLEKLMLEVMGK